MKKTKNILLLLLGGITVIAWSCNELTENILTDKQVIIIGPKDSIVTTSTTNIFAWEPVTGATKYQLQIVAPRFDSVVQFIADSTFTANSFNYALAAGKYQWRVRAVNSSSQSPYFTRTITIQ